ncbi:DUF1887 family CARF protein [Thiohalobacter sp. IOR34]|uniref:Card1-like endonuclease domain-containing protein n=1 Tax=Thiohalobacter sp. IOR34 TaxID=3057176 RepID=UPI0025B22817|nr:DUF1887 family CARF protein [Thiohalobacter sp. IOR34]WJW76673.1 DUF1887 family CARF protein [Thiohalobacter sp. IOR34]
MHTHLCLVSAQPLPNLVPLIDPTLDVKRAVLAVTTDMTERADWLEAVLRPRGIRVERLELGDAWDYDQTQSRILEWLEREGGEGIALNVTGGTKLMSIAAYESFRAYDLPIFYVHPEQDRLIWMNPDDRGSIDLADRVKLEPFLQAHGAALQLEPKRNVPEPGRLDLAEEIVLGLDKFTRILPRFNWLAVGAEKTLVSKPLENDRGELAELIDLFEAAGCLRRANGRLRFPGEKERFFAAGGWLEILVFDAVRRLRKARPGIQDVAYSIPVVREQRGKRVPNELDVAFLCNNRLHIIECKTRQFKGEGEDNDSAQALYKLDTLRDLMGGLQARAMLVSYQDLEPHDRTRAADLNIAVCAGAQLRNLRASIGDFMS